MLFAAMLLLQSSPPDARAAEATIARPVQSADGTQRWSILADPCASRRNGADEIVVCGSTAESPRLPLPAERAPPDRPMPGNPDGDGMGALAVASPPCATLSQGCTTGVDILGGGTFLVRALGKLVDPNSCCEEPGEATSPVLLARDVVRGVKRGFAKKPDKSNRIPIPLDDGPVPVAAGRAVTGP